MVCLVYTAFNKSMVNPTTYHVNLSEANDSCSQTNCGNKWKNHFFKMKGDTLSLV